MCDPSTILQLNTTGIMKLRDGKRQEAMDNFQASMASLMAHINFEAAKTDEGFATDSIPSQTAQPSTSPCLRNRKRTIDKEGLQQEQQLEQQKDHPRRSPSTIAIPFGTVTSDAFPEHATTLFNQTIVLPVEFGNHRENYDLIYTALHYNMALVLHNFGLQYSCGMSLRKALETYEVAHETLVRELQRRDGMPGNDIHHWLLYALFNNMANIYSFARSTIMTQYCLERLRLVLSHSDSTFLQTDDLLFYIVNLDVLGGPGVISAAAA